MSALAITQQHLEFAGIVVLAIVVGVAFVRGMLWAAEREALAAARRAADEYEIIVRFGPRFGSGGDFLDD